MTTTADIDLACDYQIFICPVIKTLLTQFHMSIIRFTFFQRFVYNRYSKSSSCDSYVLLLSHPLRSSGSSITSAAHMARHLASTLRPPIISINLQAPCVLYIGQAFRYSPENTFYTGLFISPSGISDLCDTVVGMVTAKGSMSTEGETLRVSVLPYRCSICPPLVTRQMSIL